MLNYGGPSLIEGRRDCHETGFCEYPLCLVVPAQCWLYKPRGDGFAFRASWTYRTMEVIHVRPGRPPSVRRGSPYALKRQAPAKPMGEADAGD